MKNRIQSLLIVGSGGREHALGWKIHHDHPESTLYFAPGNGGTSTLGINIDIGPEEILKLKRFVVKHRIDLTVVGPEAALAAGIVDVFMRSGLPIFGPTKKAARLESDKAWAAKIMEAYGIPHPYSKTFSSYPRACRYVKKIGYRQIVLKASGLAQGKGVIVPTSEKNAIEVLDGMMNKKLFADAGKRVVIQERLNGPELSVLAFCDGTTIVPLVAVQDYKRAFDNDRGPNTGGMGAIAPVPLVTKRIMKNIYHMILLPTVRAMQAEGCPYKGVLYAGLMLTSDGPKVLEYNVRFGDPETQVLLRLLASNLVSIIQSCIHGTLTKRAVRFHAGAAVCIVLAADGYPGSYAKGMVINGLDTAKNRKTIVFHAGTVMKDHRVITHGGRVLGVTAVGKNISEARVRAYGAIGEKGIHFDGMRYRKDI